MDWFYYMFEKVYDIYLNFIIFQRFILSYVKKIKLKIDRFHFWHSKCLILCHLFWEVKSYLWLKYHQLLDS